MSGQFQNLLNQNAASSFDKQLQLADFLDTGWSWQLDTHEGLLALIRKGAEKTIVPIQILGTESYSSNTWLWSWANGASQLPPFVVAAAGAMRDFGAANFIDQLTEPQTPIDDVSGDVIGMIAAGMCQGAGYFKGPYTGGAIFLLLEELPDLPPVSHAAARITTIFPQVISEMPITDHKEAFASYTEFYDFENTISENTVKASHPKFGTLEAHFDSTNRLTELKGTMLPTGTP